MLFQPNLAKAVGSDYIQRRIEELRPMAHIFGHTHFAWDAVHGGVRYVQWPLAYPQERQYAAHMSCILLALHLRLVRVLHTCSLFPVTD